MENRRLKFVAEARMEALGFHQVHAYQPPHMFVPNGRKLARCPEPCDPWLMFATMGGVCYQGEGETPMKAADAIIRQATIPALHLLGLEIDKLVRAIRAR